MMRIKFGLALPVMILLLIAGTLQAQDIPVKTLPTEIFRSVKKDKADTIEWVWKRAGLANLNLSQGSLSNWAAGGDKFSLSLNSYLNYFVLHKKNKHTWDNNLDFYFGFLQTTSQGSRKNDDRIDFISKYGYRVDSSNKLYASGLFNFRSQLFDGRKYYTRDSSSLASTFLSPAYVLISAGFDYKPVQNFSLFFSPLTTRYTFVLSNKISRKGLYGVPAGRHYIGQLGAFASINFYHNSWKNFSYKGRMDLFSDYRTKPENVDFFLTNFFSFKVNRFLSITYNLDMIYDDDVKLFGKNGKSPGLQTKSIVGIGFSLPFQARIKKLEVVPVAEKTAPADSSDTAK